MTKNNNVNLNDEDFDYDEDFDEIEEEEEEEKSIDEVLEEEDFDPEDYIESDLPSLLDEPY